MNPPLRFSTTEDWTECQLKDICEINPSVEKIPDTFQYIDLESVTNGRLLQTIPCCKSSAPSRAKRILSNEDVLFQTVRPYQKNNYFFKSDSNTSVVASTGYAQLRCTSNSAYFLYTLIHTDSFVNQVLQKCTGGAYPAITASSLSTVKINIPVVQEQQKIASFFSTLDQKIELNERKLEVLEKLKKGLMQKFFKQELRFKSPENRDYPEWEVQKLEKLCSTFKSGSSITQKSIFEAGAYPVYGGNGLRGYTDTYTHDGEYALIGRQGALCGNLKYVKGKTYISEHAIAVQANSENSTQWLYYRLKEMNLNKLSESSAQPGLSAKKLKEILINTPCLEEQIRIANFLACFDEQIKLCTNKLFMLQQLKRSFLRQMFV